jgi:hypothetical protein
MGREEIRASTSPNIVDRHGDGSVRKVREKVAAQYCIHTREHVTQNVKTFESATVASVSPAQRLNEFRDNVRPDVGNGTKVNTPHPRKITARKVE